MAGGGFAVILSRPDAPCASAANRLMDRLKNKPTQTARDICMTACPAMPGCVILLIRFAMASAVIATRLRQWTKFDGRKRRKLQPTPPAGACHFGPDPLGGRPSPCRGG